MSIHTPYIYKIRETSDGLSDTVTSASIKFRKMTVSAAALAFGHTKHLGVGTGEYFGGERNKRSLIAPLPTSFKSRPWLIGGLNVFPTKPELRQT